MHPHTMDDFNIGAQAPTIFAICVDDEKCQVIAVLQKS